MKSIITGGAGFIGSHLSEKLISLGHKVVVVDNFVVGKKKNIKNIKDKIEIVNKDIRNYDSIKDLFKNVDYVFHLAALADIVPSIENPDDYFSTNVQGTYNVLKASVENKVKRFIYSASSSCYGIPKKYPTPENEKISPLYPYALTKRMGEELVVHFSKVYKLNTTSLRFFNVYGPRARTSGTYGAVFGVFLAQKLANKPMTIVGDGNQTRDFTYVKDTCEAFEKIYLSKKFYGEVVNVGSNQEILVTGLVEKISRILNIKIKIKKEQKRIRPKLSEVERLRCDNSKIIKNTSWSPRCSFKNGIINTIDWMKNYKDLKKVYKSGKYTVWWKKK